MSIRYTERIQNTEHIGDSLVKINNNFINLQTDLCDVQQKLNENVNVRTFFYYGPNSATDPGSNMHGNSSSRPSNKTIESFVNDSEQLNIPAISKNNDIVYVIYQKTGYLESQATRITTGTTTARVISFVTNVDWSTTTLDTYNSYSPVIFVWKLVCYNEVYNTDTGFPKILQAQTLSTTNWNQPQNWLQY